MAQCRNIVVVVMMIAVEHLVKSVALLLDGENSWTLGYVVLSLAVVYFAQV